MDILPHGLSLVLYAVMAVGGATLLAVWRIASRDRLNAGFATKAHLRRQLSAKTVLRASEIRPSLCLGHDTTVSPAAVSLTKDRSNKS